MLIVTTRTSSGAGTALITAAENERLQVGAYCYLQMLEVGPVTVLLKFDDVVIHSAILLQDVAMGCVLRFPLQTSEPGAALYIDLSGNIDVSVTIEVARV